MIDVSELEQTPVLGVCTRCGYPESIVRFEYKGSTNHDNKVASLCLTCYNVLIANAEDFESQHAMAKKYATRGA